jgi:hypothetical protein
MINLAYDDISWRRFSTLLSGLSPESIFMQVFNKKEKEKPIEDFDSIARDIQAQFSRR